jgi:hypothetical protein
MVYRFLPALALVFSLAACLSDGPIGPIPGKVTHDITGIPLALSASGALPVAVTAIDQRPEVTSGKESEKFIGTERGNWSQTITITTASGNDFAQDIAELSASALARGGVPATAMPLPRKGAEEAAQAAFLAQGAERLLTIRLLEWRSDSYTRVIMKWRLEATVQDRAGTVLGRSTVAGTAPVGDTTAGSDNQKITQREMARHLTFLLGDPAITRGLR